MEPTPRKPKPFETLSIPRRLLPETGSRYRVYASHGDFKIVDADTAMEALAACGVQYAYKIMREDPMNMPLLASDAWALPPVMEEVLDVAPEAIAMDAAAQMPAV